MEAAQHHSSRQENRPRLLGGIGFALGGGFALFALLGMVGVIAANLSLVGNNLVTCGAVAVFVVGHLNATAFEMGTVTP